MQIIQHNIFDNGQPYCVDTLIKNEEWPEKEIFTAPQMMKAFFWWLENSPKSPNRMLWLFQSKGERSLRGKKNVSLSADWDCDSSNVQDFCWKRVYTLPTCAFFKYISKWHFRFTSIWKHSMLVLTQVWGCLSPIQTSQTFLTSLKWVELTLLCFALVHLSGPVAALESVRLFSFAGFESHQLKMWLLTVESKRKSLSLTVWISEVLNRT